MRLRVAYRLPKDGGGFADTFSYFHISGSALRPRNSTSRWQTDPSGRCIYQTAGNPDFIFNLHLNIPHGSHIDYLRVYYYQAFETFLPRVLRGF